MNIPGLDRRPVSWPQVLGIHGAVWIVCSGILFIAYLFPYQNSPIEICTLKKWVELPCPFCGATRSFAAAAKGEWLWAWKNSPLATVLYGLVWLVWLWNLGALCTKQIWMPNACVRSWFSTRKVVWTLIALVSANYAYRLINGLY